MRRILLKPFNDIIVDLDDIETYNHLPKTVRELDDLMFKEIGYYFHKDLKEQGFSTLKYLELNN